MASLPDLSGSAGLKALDEHLLTRSYISGFIAIYKTIDYPRTACCFRYQASRDDLAVYSALSSAPSSSYPNALRWYKHINALLGASFPGDGQGVTIAGQAAGATAARGSTSSVAAAAASAAASVRQGAAAVVGAVMPSKAPAAAADDDSDDDSDDDEDLDLFGEMTPEEQKAAEEKKRIIEAAKKRGAEKAKLTKSMVVLEVKPWDDTTDMALLEKEVRAIQREGLLWGKSQLVPIGYGIKKMQITAVIEDAKVESMDAIIEEELVRDGDSENIQSIDVVAFNKL